MSAELDVSWLNDGSEFQRNWVHGLRNPVGLHLQYRLEGERVIADWTPTQDHVGFPGIAHGGLVAAVLDDVMGRYPAMYRRWVVTAKMNVRYKAGARVGELLRVEGWITRNSRRVIDAAAVISREDGTVVAEAEATYVPVPAPMVEEMVAAWPGFAEYVER